MYFFYREIRFYEKKHLLRKRIGLTSFVELIQFNNFLKTNINAQHNVGKRAMTNITFKTFIRTANVSSIT